jgi:L-alanine-DL-glutamate epimerase-like enolase superfamily enzyme
VASPRSRSGSATPSTATWRGARRKYDRLGIGPIDIALWDIAGKAYGVPVWQLLGGWKDRLPAYASTLHGDETGPLSSPRDYADFAVGCTKLGYRAFKVHGWNGGPLSREIETVQAVRDAVGPQVALMLDPASAYLTFADTSCADAGLDAGITGVMKLAHAAEGFGLDVELHGPGPAHRHCTAAIRNTNYYELGLVAPSLTRRSSGTPAYADYHDDLHDVDEHGTVGVPDGPGLGVALDEDWIAAHAVETLECGGRPT